MPNMVQLSRVSLPPSPYRLNSHLPPPQVCQKFKTIVNDDSVLKHRLNCYVAGVADGNNQLYNLTDRGERLQRWTVGWETSRERWKRGPAQSITRTRDDRIYCDGSVLVQISLNDHMVSLTRLPAKSRGIQTETWTLPGFDFRIEDLCHDHAQGLVVLLEKMYVLFLRFHNATELAISVDAVRVNSERTARLHVLSNRTGLSHPLAAQPIIKVESDIIDWEGSGPIMKISGSLLAVSFCLEDETSLFVYDWKTGTLLKVSNYF